MNTTIRGYWVVQADEDGRQDMRDGASIASYYGYDRDDRVVTIDGLIVRGDCRKAMRIAAELAEAWEKDGHEVNYTVIALTESHYFGAYHERAVEFVGERLPA